MNLSKSQLKKAVRMAVDLSYGILEFKDLNNKSLNWREEKGVPPDIESYRRFEAEKTQ